MKRSMFREYMADWSWKKIKKGAKENKAVWSCMYAAFIMMFSVSGSIAGERARSVRLTYYFRVGIHMIIFLMGLLLLFSVGFFHWESLLFLLLNDFMLSTIVPIYGINGKAAFQLVVLLIAIMLTNMAQLVVISGPEPHRTVQIILYAIFFLIELPLFIGFSQYIKKELCAARNFEEVM